MNVAKQDHQSMSSKPNVSSAEERFLGVIHTSITGKKNGYIPPAKAEPAFLIRETANITDPFAIRVQDKSNDPLGYVSRSVSKWLSPLLKDELIRAEGMIPARSGAAQSLKSSTGPLEIHLYSSTQDGDLWEIKDIKNRKDVLHQLVYQAYRIAQGFREAALFGYLTDGLRSLVKLELHPQTHLLLTLLANGKNEKI